MYVCPKVTRERKKEKEGDFKSISIKIYYYGDVYVYKCSIAKELDWIGNDFVIKVKTFVPRKKSNDST